MTLLKAELHESMVILENVRSTAGETHSDQSYWRNNNNLFIYNSNNNKNNLAQKS